MDYDNRIPTGIRWFTPMVIGRLGAVAVSAALFGQLAWRILS